MATFVLISVAVALPFLKKTPDGVYEVVPNALEVSMDNRPVVDILISASTTSGT